MFWADKIAADTQQDREIIVNDSKTPSGRVHVGSLRGVVIHDVIYRALKHAGHPVKFIYGVDDYDALDTVPHYLAKEKFAEYLGHPLCNVPSPTETATDYAKYFMGEFLEVFRYLGITPEVYYLRDLYRNGRLNRYIDIFLQNAGLVKEAYKEVSKSDRASDWYPFHPICDRCGKIATTVVSDYNGKEVFYTCKPDSTNYVKGCGHSGWKSPFDGNGKLPWKVEWVAKWDLLGVNIEMAGKDHSQKGGSRDVANSISRKVLQKQPPFHSPYEFILVNGTKMSSSKGVGSSAKEIAGLLPPELLRFLMLRTPPKTVINFSPNYETITRLFRDYDALIDKYGAENSQEAIADKDIAPLVYAQLDDEIKHYQSFDISTLISLLQVPHLDIEAEIVKRSHQPLTELDWQVVRQRVTVARKWLQDYADEEEKLVLYLDKVPDRAQEITTAQKTYFHKLIANLETYTNWDGEELQTLIFSTARELEFSQKDAFQAIYLCFLGKDKGPKAGSLFSYLDKSFVIKRLQEVSI
jgi:lysyl-tRNA synthetase, class I